MTDFNKIPIALVGFRSDGAFVKALRSGNFDVQQVDSVPDPKKKGTHISVLAIMGEEHTLSVAEIDQWMRSKTVLALFAPSRAVLETIHKATNTPIDIPSLYVPQGLPLLVYMVNDFVHIAPNNVPSKVKIQELAQDAVRKDGKLPSRGSFSVSLATVEPEEQAIMSISYAVSTVQSMKLAASMLDPPSGVIGFKKGVLDNTARISINWLAWRSDGQFGVETSDPTLIQKYDLNWYTDFYAYATGTDCRGMSSSEFTSAGGVVYTVAIDRGSLLRSSSGAPRYLGPTSGYCGYYFVDWNQTGSHAESSMKLLSYQPRGLDSQIDTTYNYSVDFQQDMQMFNNNGNEQYTFSAQYSTQFSLDRFQLHELQDTTGVDYSVDYKDYYDHWSDPGFDTNTWWEPGVYEEVNREGWEHWIVREYLPADNLPINGLSVFSSSVGKHTFISKYETGFRAFKSNAWRCSSDDDTTHFQVSGVHAYSDDGSNILDLTWS
ncbi:Gfo/Idh/MocA-like oxidoreductase N-terminal domain-containing protein [Pleurotus pulmonarius]